MARTAEQQFAEIDTDKDGFITPAELKRSLQADPNVSDTHVQQTMQLIDENGDARITLQEFKQLVRPGQN